MTFRSRTAHAALVALLVPAAQAIIPGITTAAYPFVGKLGGGSFNTTGVAIGDHWILTARHTVFGFSQDGAHFALDSGETYQSIAIFEHPTDDIALVKVAETLPGWYDIYWNTNQPGLTGDMVGYGSSSAGGYGTKKRGANRVSFTQFAVLAPDLQGDFMIYDYDGPGVDWFGDGGAVTDESTFGGGDSGGPTFLSDGGIQKVAGVHSWVGSAGGPQYPNFGSILGDVRVSSYRTWYDGIVPAEVLAAATFAPGAVISGSPSNLTRSDNSYYTGRPGVTLTSALDPLKLNCTGTSPVM
jgi:hypothetical protein